MNDEKPIQMMQSGTHKSIAVDEYNRLKALEEENKKLISALNTIKSRQGKSESFGIIKSEFNRLKRLEETYKDMVNFMNMLSEFYIKPRIVINDENEISLNWSDDVTHFDIIFTGNQEYSYFGKSHDKKIYGDNISINSMPFDVKMFLEPLDDRDNKRLKRLDENIKKEINKMEEINELYKEQVFDASCPLYRITQSKLKFLKSLCK